MTTATHTTRTPEAPEAAGTDQAAAAGDPTATGNGAVGGAPVADGLTVVEGPTAEAALAELHRQLGPTAQVVEVHRTHRGGVGGFFAREVVQLHARSGDAPRTAAPSPAPAASPSTSPVDRLLSSDDGVVDFATHLRSQIDVTAPPVATHGRDAARDLEARRALIERATAAARAAAAATPGGGAVGPASGGGVVDPATGTVLGAAPVAATEPVRPPATVATDRPEDLTDVDPDTDPGDVGEVAAAPLAASDPIAPIAPIAPTDLTDPTGRLGAEPIPSTEPGPAWSVAALIKLGLPAGLVRDLEVADPSDDVAWTAALAGALRPVCRPLPSGRSLLLGPRARSIANATGATPTAVHQPIRSRAQVVAATVGSGAAARAWVERSRGTRWLHVVVGGKGWRPLLHLDPLAVSWATIDDLPETVRLAVELGLVLGSGPLRAAVGRARPLEVALALRDLLPVRR